MAELRWIKMSLFLILRLQFIAGKNPLDITVRDGDEVTLPCENVTKDQDKCDRTTWIFTSSRNTAAVELITLGQIGSNARSKSDRLSVTAICSLVIKKVTVEDVGLYSCRQYNTSGQQQGQDAQVLLSVVTMTDHKETDKVMLSCSVLTYGHCRHAVNWLLNEKDWGKTRDTQTSSSPCSDTVSLPTSQLICTSHYMLLKCNVTDLNSRKVQLYNFCPQLSQEKPDWWWLYILVAAALVALLIIVMVLIRWKRSKMNKTQMDDRIGLGLNPAVTQPAPETNQDTADPEDGVSYSSISYIKRTNSKAQVRRKDDADEGDAVTYTTVKAPSSSAAASTDPRNHYATIS